MRNEVLAYLRPRTVEVGDCLIWTRAKSSSGAPVATIGGARSINIRRWVVEQCHGEIPTGWSVRSHCGHKCCVHPDHLAALPWRDHVQRLHRDGAYDTPACRARQVRKARAEAKLTLDLAREVRALRAQGATLKSIAGRVGVNPTTISRICRGIYWADTVPNASAFSWRGTTRKEAA